MAEDLASEKSFEDVQKDELNLGRLPPKEDDDKGEGNIIVAEEEQNTDIKSETVVEENAGDNSVEDAQGGTSFDETLHEDSAVADSATAPAPSAESGDKTSTPELMDDSEQTAETCTAEQISVDKDAETEPEDVAVAVTTVAHDDDVRSDCSPERDDSTKELTEDLTKGLEPDEGHAVASSTHENKDVHEVVIDTEAVSSLLANEDKNPEESATLENKDSELTPETLLVDEKSTSEKVSTSNEKCEIISKTENSNLQNVKGHDGDSEAPSVERKVNPEKDMSAESVKPILIFPNPEPETALETDSNKVKTNGNETVQTNTASVDVVSGNANNNAKDPVTPANDKIPKSTAATSGGNDSDKHSAKPSAPSQDIKDRVGKSYSAQRSAIRGNRKGGPSDSKSPDKSVSKTSYEATKVETRGKISSEELSFKEKPNSDQGRDGSPSNRPREIERENKRRQGERRSEKQKDRERESGWIKEGRDKRFVEPAPVNKKPAKSKEEREKEDLELKAALKKKQEEEEQRLLEEENIRLAEEEQKHANEISVEATERKQAKIALRFKNLAAAAERPDEDFFVKLDSNMKKNTTFVRKLKLLTEQQRDSLTAEFNSLNLTKYVGEVATAIVESKFKMVDISCAVHVCSLVHQRYAEFSSHLLQAIQKCHPGQTKKDDAVKETKKEPIVFDPRIRVELRFLAELIVAGVFTEKEGLPALNTLLSSILKADKESHAHVSISISFLKHCGEDFAGLVPRRNRLLAEKFGLTLPSSEIFSAQRKSAYKGLLKEHYLSLTKHLLKEHKELQNMEKHNRRILQTKGELSEERRKRLDELQSSYQKLLVNTSTYADLIDDVVPDLPEAELTAEERELMSLDYLGKDISGAEFDFDTSLWEDEDTRTFHENLIDLRTMVPGILFKDSEKKATPEEKQEELEKLGEDIEALEQTEETDSVTLEGSDSAETGHTEHTEGAAEDEVTVEDMETAVTSEPEQEDAEEEEEETEQVTNMSKKMVLDAFLQRLPQCVNRDFIDKAAVEFCMDLNTKINRRKLIKALFNVPRTRLDLLPFYSRLVATLYPCMPDIGTELVEKLKADFRWHMRKKDQMMIETKIKTVRFMGELTKFRMCPKSDTLQCVKWLLQEFRHHNIDMVCNVLDSCGRFLYRSSDSHLLTKALLEIMMRKKSKLHLNERHTTMVENTFFYCNPPDVKQAERKERPVMHQYIRKLIYRDLSKTTTEKVLKQLRKIDWNNNEIKTYITKCLSNVWNIKYNNIHCAASLLAGLVPYHDDVGIQVVDAVLEDIRIGMEINHAKFNQRRVSIVKYLGELYNYRMVESAVVFKTLYSVIRFGITLDGADDPLDPPEHLFRLRLVCTLLDTCGQFFDRGTSKKKLDCFLVYFQQYIMYKRSLSIWNPQLHPFPLDNDNAIADTLETLRPKLKIYATLEEANEAVAELEKEQVQKHGSMIQAALAAVNPHQQTPYQLGTITETDEAKTSADMAVEFTSIVEDEEISDSDSETEGVSHRREGAGRDGHTSDIQSHSQNTGDEEVTDDQLALDSAGETEEDDTVTVLTGGPKLIKCEEDDDFTTEFDKMLSDNVQQRTVDAIKVPQQDIAIPAQARPRPKKVNYDIFQQAEEVEIQTSESVNFVLMMRCGNKHHYHEFEVPKSSELAANLRNREKLELAEKQRLKELTLNINDRQEEEDYQEMLAQFQKPATVVVPVAPKERKPKFHHPKGAPDADQIFNSSGNRKW